MKHLSLLLKHWKINKDYNIDKLLYLLIDRPDKIDSLYIFHWHNNKGQYHRDYDLPAITSLFGIFWHKNGRRYRTNNKPNEIWSDDTIKNVM